MTNYNAEEYMKFVAEIDTLNKKEKMEMKVLDMAWQLYCFGKYIDGDDVMNKCIEEAKQFIKTYKEMGK